MGDRHAPKGHSSRTGHAGPSGPGKGSSHGGRGGFNKQGKDPKNKHYSKGKPKSTGPKKSYDKGLVESFVDLGKKAYSDVSNVASSISKSFNDTFGGPDKPGNRSYGFGDAASDIGTGIGQLASGDLDKAFGSFNKAFEGLGDSVRHDVDSFFSGDPKEEDTRAGWEKFADAAMDAIGLGEEDSQASFADRVQTEIDDFVKAPLDYAADLMDNSFVGTAVKLGGLGLTSFGITAMDAVADVVQDETTLANAGLTMMGSAVVNTPLGVAFGPFRGMIGTMAKKPDEAAETFSGSIAGRMGAQFGGLMGNDPMSRAVTASVGGTIASAAAKSYTKEHMGEIDGSMTARADRRGVGAYEAPSMERTVSPLAASGRQAVQRSQSMMQPAYATMYADTMRQLPTYGIQTKQFPTYGIS